MSLITCIQDQRDYYKRLSKELENENRIKNELRANNSIRDEFSRLIDLKQSQVFALEKQSKKEYEEVRKLSHLSFKSAAATLSGKKKELKAKEEAGYQLAFENEQKAKRELGNLQKQLNDTITMGKGLEKQKQQYDESRAQFDALLDQIFESEDPTFPQNAQIKAEIRNYQDQRQMAKRDKRRFLDAEDQLTKSIMNIQKAMQLLSRTLNYEPFDIFGTPMLEEDQIRNIEAGTILIRHGKVVKAVQCLGQLTAVQQNVQNSINWVAQYKNYAEGAINRLATAIESSKFILEKERRSIIENVLNGHLEGLNIPKSSNLDLPPPVYEAPPTAGDMQKKSEGSKLSNMNSNQNLLVAPEYTQNNPSQTTPESNSNPFNHPQKPINPNNPFNYQ